VCGVIAEKVYKGQAHRVVVSLQDSRITRAELERYLRENPIPQLREVITIDREGRIGQFSVRRQTMGLDASFMIEAEGAPAALKQVLLRTDYFESAEDIDGDKVVRATGVRISIYTPPIRTGVLEEAGVRANLALYLANSDNRFTYEWKLNSVRAVMALLHAYPGDALFMYCSDSPALLRKDGRVILDKRAGLWDEGEEPQVLSLVDLPYTFGTIAVT
jgi:hypothetical protein